MPKAAKPVLDAVDLPALPDPNDSDFEVDDDADIPEDQLTHLIRALRRPTSELCKAETSHFESTRHSKACELCVGRALACQYGIKGKGLRCELCAKRHNICSRNEVFNAWMVRRTFRLSWTRAEEMLAHGIDLIRVANGIRSAKPKLADKGKGRVIPPAGADDHGSIGSALTPLDEESVANVELSDISLPGDQPDSSLWSRSSLDIGAALAMTSLAGPKPAEPSTSASPTTIDTPVLASSHPKQGPDPAAPSDHNPNRARPREQRPVHGQQSTATATESAPSYVTPARKRAATASIDKPAYKRRKTGDMDLEAAVSLSAAEAVKLKKRARTAVIGENTTPGPSKTHQRRESVANTDEHQPRPVPTLIPEDVTARFASNEARLAALEAMLNPPRLPGPGTSPEPFPGPSTARVIHELDRAIAEISSGDDASGIQRLYDLKGMFLPRAVESRTHSPTVSTSAKGKGKGKGKEKAGALFFANAYEIDFGAEVPV
ncbi:hypothetical protein MKEN_01386300 [Mycena kentingensis (nom. inval.)]|nr:hypothetical protein MKEN_01386300 [Mycena kentingensis (nom. inval.)]